MRHSSTAHVRPLMRLCSVARTESAKPAWWRRKRAARAHFNRRPLPFGATRRARWRQTHGGQGQNACVGKRQEARLPVSRPNAGFGSASAGQRDGALGAAQRPMLPRGRGWAIRRLFLPGGAQAAHGKIDPLGGDALALEERREVGVAPPERKGSRVRGVGGGGGGGRAGPGCAEGEEGKARGGARGVQRGGWGLRAHPNTDRSVAALSWTS